MSTLLMTTSNLKKDNDNAQLVFVQPIFHQLPTPSSTAVQDSSEMKSYNTKVMKYSPFEYYHSSLSTAINHNSKYPRRNYSLPTNCTYRNGDLSSQLNTLNANRRKTPDDSRIDETQGKDSPESNSSSAPCTDKSRPSLGRSASCDDDGDIKIKHRDGRRVSILVDELLLKIYGGPEARGSSDGTDGNTIDYTTDSSNNASTPPTLYKSNIMLLKKKRYFTGIPEDKCKKWNDMMRNRLMNMSVNELTTLKKSLEYNVSHVGSKLIRQLKRRDLLFTKQDKQCSIITAFLQAMSAKRSEDMKIQFSMRPNAGESGFQQWHEAMKMVARLSGGIPYEFRRTLWLTLAERHIASKNINWPRVERSCFNDTMNPDDEELGVQIVKDLHRTGCSLFCGSSAEENQAVLKRVLLAYARWNKSVGYCQGFNMLAALILEVMDRCEYDSLKVMIYLIEGVLPESYFANSLRGLSIDMAVFRDLLRIKLPKLSRHLEQLQSDSNEMGGNVYEPPLTNVFTMQWFLTLFCNCLPHSTVLRVWDLIFLEGNRVLLKTALAIWDALSDRIMPVTSADEFYSIMGVLTREMLEFGLMDANSLIKTVTNIELPELTELRERYIYNITPWTQVARKGLRLFYADYDSEDDSDDNATSTPTPNDERTTAAEGAYGFLKAATKHGSQSIRSISPSYILGPFSGTGEDKEKKALDISALKKQYRKIKERQRQAQIIFTAACNSHVFFGSMTSSTPTPAINHLMLSKACPSKASLPRGRKSAALPVPRIARQSLAETSSGSGADGGITSADSAHNHRGETVYWNKKMKTKRKRHRSEIKIPQNDTPGCDPSPENTPDVTAFTFDSYPSSPSSLSLKSSSSSSTELCDEMVEFDSEDATNSSLNEFTFPRRRLPSYTSSPADDIIDDLSRPSDKPHDNLAENSPLVLSSNDLPSDSYTSLVDNYCAEQQPDQPLPPATNDSDRERILNLLLTTSIIASEQLTKHEEKKEVDYALSDRLDESDHIFSFGGTSQEDGQHERLNQFISNINRLSRTLSDTGCTATTTYPDSSCKLPQTPLPPVLKTHPVDSINLKAATKIDAEDSAPEVEGEHSQPATLNGDAATNPDIQLEYDLHNMKINALEILFSSTTLESILCNKPLEPTEEAEGRISPPMIKFTSHEDNDHSPPLNSVLPAAVCFQVEKTELELKEILQQNTELLRKVNQNYNSKQEESLHLNGYSPPKIFEGANQEHLFEPYDLAKNNFHLIESPLSDTDQPPPSSCLSPTRRISPSDSSLDLLAKYETDDEFCNSETPTNLPKNKHKSLDSLNANANSKLKAGLIDYNQKWISISIDNSDLTILDEQQPAPPSPPQMESTPPLTSSKSPVPSTCLPTRKLSSGRAFAEPTVLDPHLHINFDIVARKKSASSPPPPIHEYCSKKNILSHSYHSTELKDRNFTPFPLKPNSRPPKELGIKLGLYSSGKK